MAVLVEGISVIILAESLIEKFTDDWEGFKAIVPNQTLCADQEIVRVGFQVPDDVESFIKELETYGLVFLEDDESVDIAVADQLSGLTKKCQWLKFGHAEINDNGDKVAACWLKGSKSKRIFFPIGWTYEKSLSASFAYVPNEHLQKAIKFLRHENGIDVYLNPLTGKEYFVGRTDNSSLYK